MTELHRTKNYHRLAAALLLISLALLAGCQTYHAKPLAMQTTYRDLASRLADEQAIEAFKESLAESDHELPADFDLADGISPAEAEVIALFYNHDLNIARKQAGVALATKETVGLWEDPVFGFDAEEIWSPSAPFLYGMTVSVTIPISGRLKVAEAHADAEYKAQLRRIVNMEWALRASVRTAWVNWVTAEQHAAVHEQAIAQIGELKKVTDNLVESGQLNRLEGRVFSTELLQRQAHLIESKMLAKQARLTLLQLMGLLPDADVKLQNAFPALPDQAMSSDPTDQLIRNNTQLAISRAEYHAAEEKLRLEIQKQYPDITIGTGYGSEENDDRLLLGFSVPIPILNANKAAIGEAAAKRSIARAQAERTLAAQLAELRTAEQTNTVASEQLEMFESQIVPMLSEQSRELHMIVELGEVDTFLMLDTVTRQADTRKSLLNIKQNLLTSRIAITQLLGPTSAAQETGEMQ